MEQHTNREIVLVDGVVDAVYAAICQIALAKPVEMQEVPEGADEEAAEKIKEANEKATETNTQLEKDQKKICLRIIEEAEVYPVEDEKALLKVNNIRETVEE